MRVLMPQRIYSLKSNSEEKCIKELISGVIVAMIVLPRSTIGDRYTISGALPSFQMPDFSYDTVAAVRYVAPKAGSQAETGGHTYGS